MLEPLLPVSNNRCGRWRDHRQVINGIIHRLGTGVQWRELPERFGPWKTVHKRHLLWSADGTWERLLRHVQSTADTEGGIDWNINVDSTITRAHQHAAGAPRICVVTRHRLLGTTWLPLGTTAHKQGRIAGENALGGNRRFVGSLGTQVVKVFDLVAARTGLRDHEAIAAGRGWIPATTASRPDDHKAYYPGATPIAIRVTGDTDSGLLLGAQLVGRRGAEVAKRVDTFATALFHGMAVDGISELDLSYTPPLGSPWDAIQIAAQAWMNEHHLDVQRRMLDAF